MYLLMTSIWVREAQHSRSYMRAFNATLQVVSLLGKKSRELRWPLRLNEPVLLNTPSDVLMAVVEEPEPTVIIERTC